MNSSPDSCLSPEDGWSFLEQSRRQWLDKSWAGTFRQHLLEKLPIEALEKQFPDKGGRPRKDFCLVLGVLILQQMHNLTDAETVEAVAFNLAWHYALGVAPYSKVFLCERTLRNYRRVVIEQELEQVLFRELTDELVKAFQVETTRQRIDSTAVCSAMRRLNRLGIVVETVSKFLRELVRLHPVLFAQVEDEIVRLYVKRSGEGCFGLTKPSEAKARLPEATAVLGKLVLQFAPTEAADLSSYALLRQVFDQQCEWSTNEGDLKIRIKVPDEIPCDSIHSPADPDSSYNKHRGHGYGIQIMETYVEDDAAAGVTEDEPTKPDLILHVAVGKLTEHDSHALEPAITDVRERGMSQSKCWAIVTMGVMNNCGEWQPKALKWSHPPCHPKATNKGNSLSNNLS